MDLTTLWQEHKTFILSVMMGLLVFFVGQAAISSIYPVDDKKRDVRRLDSDLRKAKSPTSGELSDARSLNEELSQSYDNAITKIRFKPNPKYQLSNSAEKPDIQYDRLYTEARETLVEGAKSLNISVDASLGMPELSPTRVSEIQKSLTALDIVTRVVLTAIESQVRSVESISMTAERRGQRKTILTEHSIRFKMRGSVNSIAEFLERFSKQETYLAIDDASFKMSDVDGAVVAADFTVSAMVVLQEEGES